jgi:hypothetical protein
MIAHDLDRRSRAPTPFTPRQVDSLFFHFVCSNGCAVLAIRVSTESTSPFPTWLGGQHGEESEEGEEGGEEAEGEEEVAIPLIRSVLLRRLSTT